jgi:hypothetical protein
MKYTTNISLEIKIVGKLYEVLGTKYQVRSTKYNVPSLWKAGLFLFLSLWPCKLKNQKLYKPFQGASGLTPPYKGARGIKYLQPVFLCAHPPRRTGRSLRE